MFTDRDSEGSYDTQNIIDITLEDDTVTCSSSAVKIEGTTITIQKEGAYRLSGTLKNGQIIVDADSQKVQLVPDNADINCDTNIDAVIFSKDDLTLNGTGALTLKAAYGHGIVSKNDLVITGGQYQITAAKHALSGKDSVRIADGTFTMDAGSDGIHSENTQEEEKGFIYLAGGEFTITCDSDGLDAEETLQIDGGTLQIAAGDDGIHSDADLIINDGNLKITKSYEGLEGTTISIHGDSCEIKSDDDGLNAANGNSTSSGKSTSAPDSKTAPGGGMDQVDDACRIQITAGTLTIDAGGDGIDSNGNLIVSGGEIYVYGPTNSGNNLSGLRKRRSGTTGWRKARKNEKSAESRKI